MKAVIRIARNRVLTDTEEKMSEMIWLSLFGGHQKFTFREVRKGIQSVKVTGTAFLRSDSGVVHRISGLRGHFHPATTGGKKRFDITGLRLVANNKPYWLCGDDIWQVLNPIVQEVGFHHKECGTYYVSIE